MRIECFIIVSLLILAQACQYQRSASALDNCPKEVMELLHKETHIANWTRVQKDKAEKTSKDLRQQYIAHDAWDTKIDTAEKSNKVTVIVLESAKYYAVIWLYPVTDKYITQLHAFIDCISKESGTTLFCGDLTYNYPME